MEAVEDQLYEIQNNLEAKFEALKEITIGELGEERTKRLDFEQRL